ncbi:MAG: radical SAM protein, partial [Paludibacteraceae bacterium]|nr:radical SAM protein [Paludibacteraceae bacterium]
MAGVYVHIPFCKKRCKYCDFYSTTDLRRRAAYVDALLREIEDRQSEIHQEPVRTIYFGGGTPSQLAVE